MTGKVTLIGAGPGNPDLLTIKGKEKIEQADCIIYDRLASPKLLGYAKKDCEFIYVGKENHHHTMKQDDINELLYQKALLGKDIVRLKGGDPYVFGRGGEEALFLIERNIEVEVVSGISSSIAALADAGIPITHRGLSKGFQVITGHSRKDKPAEIDYSQLMDPTVTYVFLMGLSHVREIANGLIEAGRDKNTPAAVVSNGTTARQRKSVGTLENIAELVERDQLPLPAIIVVGDVVTLSDKLNFFEKRVLFGQKFLVPYIESFKFDFSKGIIPEKKEDYFDSKLEVTLRKNGAHVDTLLIGKIKPVEIERSVFLNLLKADWFIFTSQNAVNSFFWNLRKNGLDARSIGDAKIAVVGSRTNQCLEKFGLCADLIPDKQTAKDLCEALLDLINDNKKIVFFSGKESSPEIEAMLSDNNELTKQVCYVNEVVSNEGTVIHYEDYDGVVFTSASSVRRSLSLSDGTRPKKVFSIGPSCSMEVEKHGITEFEEAKEHNYKGLIDMVIGRNK